MPHGDDGLRRALAKLEALLAASPVGIAFFDREFRYLRINQALATINGRSIEEHIGRTIHEVIPEVAPQLETLLRGVLETGQPVLNLQVTAVPPSTPGVLRHFLATFFPVGIDGDVTGIGAVVVEVTELENAKHALEVSKARLQSIIEHAPAAIFVVDEVGTLVLANQKTAAVLGRPGENVVGLRAAELLPSELETKHRASDRKVLEENRPIAVEEVVPSPEGPRTFLSIKFPLPGDDQRRFVCGISTEITERKRMEAALQAAVRAREETLAIVSHDLRSPLNAVQLGVSMLHAHVTDERARRHVEMIQRSCDRMERLIEDLLSSASIQAGTLALVPANEDAESIVVEAVELHQALAVERGVRLERDGSVKGVIVRCDRSRILQVFANLIGNALKFCRNGCFTTVGATASDDEVTFSVADTGPGIAPEVLPHLFDPFWSAPQHRDGGTGLGLYIAKGIVERHGGRLWVESEPGRGTRFSFTIPRARS
ncbi:MAG TPA: PAS domain-containing sensor histidine kinase [Kofleriaceae bacterium]|nr:PAS domain-containing sensor histidine kinase [Kofleriaceae bacterium]